MMFGILKRLLQVLLVITGIAIYVYQIYLWNLFGKYLGMWETIEGINIFIFSGVFPIWILIPYGCHALISWIITGEIYTTKEYKELYIKIKRHKIKKVIEKAQKQAGNLSIVKKDDAGGLSIL